MEKVLVTGAYGFLGRYVVKELKENGYYVIAFGRNKEKIESLVDENVEGFVGDFCNFDDIDKACQKADYVIHCGALLRLWGKKKDFMYNNVHGTQNVLDACAKNNIKKLVYCSSPSVKATLDNLHITENDYNMKNKINYYVESKIKAESLVKAQTKVKYSIIRPRGICGIGDTSMLPTLIKANEKIGIPLFKKGQVMVDMTCVDNVAYALRLCLESEKADYQIYNITNGEPQVFTNLLDELFKNLHKEVKYLKMNFRLMYFISSVLEFIFKLFHIYKKAPMITKYNVCMLACSQVFDITKAQTELGYAPKITLMELLDKYAKKYNEEHKQENEESK